MENDISEILFYEEQIKQRIIELGNQLSEDFKDKNPLVICVLKGAFVFMSDLIRNMSIPLEVDFMAVSSYGAARPAATSNARLASSTPRSGGAFNPGKAIV